MPELNKKLNGWTYSLLFAAILLQSLSFVSLKYATIFKMPLWILFILLAFFLLMLRAIVWQMLLKRNDLSNLYPFNSLSQISTLALSALLFHEVITAYNIIGVLVMILGIAILGKRA